MDNRDPRGRKDQLEEHSLPGTNQAGTGPEDCDENSQPDKSRAKAAHQEDQLEKHSLPGTNQAGKGGEDDEK